jgi:hypothetical protein
MDIDQMLLPYYKYSRETTFDILSKGNITEVDKHILSAASGMSARILYGHLLRVSKTAVLADSKMWAFYHLYKFFEMTKEHLLQDKTLLN